MGNCVPAYKNNKDPDHAMNLSSAQIQSPNKENFVRSDNSIAEPPSMETSFRDLSKTDENFFDSQAWLESDCEDFFSVNGDSRGSSPNHHKSLTESSVADKNHSMDRTQNAVPQHDKKKLLIELFRESLDDDQSLKEKLEDKAATTFNLPPKSTSRSPTSVHSSEATPIYMQHRKEKSSLSPQCCLPNLVRNKSTHGHGIGERKKWLSPAKTAGL